MDEERQTVIAGKNPVMEALEAGVPLHKVFVRAGAHGMERWVARAREQDVPVQHVDVATLHHLVPGVRHQGIVAIAAAQPYASLDELVHGARQGGQCPMLVVLDGIEDPHNLGSILRTVDCVGAHGVIVPKRRSAGLSATVARTSAGASAHVRVARVTNIAQTIDTLKKEGLWVFGTVVEGHASMMGDVDLTVPLALVIGGEASGVSRLVRERCDALLRIPMAGKMQSLNASVAAAVLLYEAMRQRSKVYG
ncbi:MAG: 23S rRNA (guanosine(2251)-2'-O)-methyltransferase RlmB [Paenibacillaceae bacterium]|nr:23S rRNA (guanosine(2251)-2'-O)-methyltransferase RlmB [Paenibacillaceae bacterium]